MRAIVLALALLIPSGAMAEAHACKHHDRYCRSVGLRHQLRAVRHLEAVHAKRVMVRPPRPHPLPWSAPKLIRGLRWHRHHLKLLMATPTPYCVGQVGNRLLGCLEVLRHGGTESEWNDVDYIYTHESGWQTHDRNSLGCDQIPQACPASKTGCGADDALCQIKWGIGYMVGRYGSIAGAARFWHNNHWY